MLKSQQSAAKRKNLRLWDWDEDQISQLYRVFFPGHRTKNEFLTNCFSDTRQCRIKFNYCKKFISVEKKATTVIAYKKNSNNLHHFSLLSSQHEYAQTLVRTFRKVNILTCNSIFQHSICNSNTQAHTHTCKHEAKVNKSKGNRPARQLLHFPLHLLLPPVALCCPLLCSDELKTYQTLMRDSLGATWQLLLTHICIATVCVPTDKTMAHWAPDSRPFYLPFPLYRHTVEHLVLTRNAYAECRTYLRYHLYTVCF